MSSSLLLPDVGTNLVWHQETGVKFAGTYDGGFEHFILNNNRANAIVRRAVDGATFKEKGLGRGNTF